MWLSHADLDLAKMAVHVAGAGRLPLKSIDVDGGLSDAESFARMHIRSITFHSVTRENLDILHSANDTFLAIGPDQASLERFAGALISAQWARLHSRAGPPTVLYGTTRKATLLESVPPGVTTSTLPLVAPAGTVVVISEFETTVKVAAVPLKVTLVEPVSALPKMLTAAPTAPDVGWVSTNGPNPADNLKTVPQLSAPPILAVP